MTQMKKKLIGLAAAALVLLQGCSFENIMQDDLLMTVQDQQTVSTAEYTYRDLTTLRVPVGETTLNPYQMVTDTSLRVVPLLYDSLVKLNLSYGYDLCIASQIDLQGTACTVTIRPDIFFWDGTPLTAADVQYSYRQAVATQNQYTQQLSNTTGVRVLSDTQIIFTLEVNCTQSL